VGDDDVIVLTLCELVPLDLLGLADFDGGEGVASPEVRDLLDGQVVAVLLDDDDCLHLLHFFVKHATHQTDKGEVARLRLKHDSLSFCPSWAKLKNPRLPTRVLFRFMN